MLGKVVFFGGLLSLIFSVQSAFAVEGAEAVKAAAPVAQAAVVPAKPYRTFITLQRYTVEKSGQENALAQVKLEVTFPNGKKLSLPEDGQYWPISNGQSQEINKTFELPYQMVANDGFKFRVQMLRKGGKLLPCEFDVVQLSQFNRAYICRTDEGWQQQQRVANDKIDREAVQLRIFTDLNSPAKEIPNTALAIR